MGGVSTRVAISSAHGIAESNIFNGFMGVPPPLSPHMGGAVPRLVLVVGGPSGHRKLEPPAKFTGKGFLTV